MAKARLPHGRLGRMVGLVGAQGPDCFNVAAYYAALTTRRRAMRALAHHLATPDQPEPPFRLVWVDLAESTRDLPPTDET